MNQDLQIIGNLCKQAVATQDWNPKEYMRRTHELPYTGSVIYGTGAAVPTLALSRYLGGSIPLSLTLAGAAGLAGGIYGYNR